MGKPFPTNSVAHVLYVCEKPALKEQRLVTLQRLLRGLAACTLKSLGPHMVSFLNTGETTSIKLILRAGIVSLLSLYLGALH